MFYLIIPCYFIVLYCIFLWHCSFTHYLCFFLIGAKSNIMREHLKEIYSSWEFHSLLSIPFYPYAFKNAHTPKKNVPNTQQQNTYIYIYTRSHTRTHMETHTTIRIHTHTRQQLSKTDTRTHSQQQKTDMHIHTRNNITHQRTHTHTLNNTAHTIQCTQSII